jgi:hypothetical protein
MANDFNGGLYTNAEGNIPTYSAVIQAYTPYATANDIIALSNPSTSSVMLKVSRIIISGDATAASIQNLGFYLRPGLNTSGTPTAISAAQHDTNDAAPTGTVVTYAAAPTTSGTGLLLRNSIFILANAGTPSGSAPPLIDYTFGMVGNAKQPHVRPGQCFTVSNNGSAVASGTKLYINIEWSETANYT